VFFECWGYNRVGFFFPCSSAGCGSWFGSYHCKSARLFIPTNNPQHSLHDLSSMGGETFVVNKTGSDEDLDELYARLDDPHLLGFCKSGLIMDEKLVPYETL